MRLLLPPSTVRQVESGATQRRVMPFWAPPVKTSAERLMAHLVEDLWAAEEGPAEGPLFEPAVLAPGAMAGRGQVDAARLRQLAQGKEEDQEALRAMVATVPRMKGASLKGLSLGLGFGQVVRPPEPQDDRVHHGPWTGRASKLFGTRKGPGTREEASAMIRMAQAQPGAFFLGRDYTLGSLAEYMGAANWCRGQAAAGQMRWAHGGWQSRLGPHEYEDTYSRSLETLREWKIREGLRASDLVLARLREMDEWQDRRRDEEGAQQVDRLWAGFMAGLGTGDLEPVTGQDPLQGFEWADVAGLALPMRILTAEQIGMALPSATQKTVDAAVASWVRQGYLDQNHLAHKETGMSGSLPIFRVTRKAAEEGALVGLLKGDEIESRLAIRRTQEVHDLGVGDTLLLFALHGLVNGQPIKGIVTEAEIKRGQKLGMVPDVRLELPKSHGLGTRLLDVEVLGSGGRYRTHAKITGSQRSGMRVMSAGQDGNGVRYA